MNKKASLLKIYPYSKLFYFEEKLVKPWSLRKKFNCDSVFELIWGRYSDKNIQNTREAIQ